MTENDNTQSYPKTWTAMIGQEQIKRILQIAVKSAKVRKAGLDHVLLTGPGGMGKTAFAHLVAKMSGRKFRVISGKVNAMQARMILTEMSDGDILFYDEIHQAGKQAEEWLLTFLADGEIAGPFGMDKMPRVTMIAATTEPGKLSPTVVGRFPLQCAMVDYTVEEATKVAMSMSKDILGDFNLAPLKKADAEAIARAGAKNPRSIRRLLITLRDLALVKEVKVTAAGRYDIEAVLTYAGVTPDGLDRVAQQYLVVLKDEFRGVAGARPLEERLSQPGGLAHQERLLQEMGLVAKTRGGRQLTTAGIIRARELSNALTAAA